MKDFRIFLKPGDLPLENQETLVRVQDEETLEFQEVRALLSRSFESLSDADRLWLYSYEGHGQLLEEKAWAIKLLERKEEAAEQARVIPKRRKTLTDLIRERQEQE
ncbi:MAG TPA: hypothetical protein VJ256_06580 [Dehalococcoidia bacterium]|nr:hypothetical protein [Dehalococcoidia bacterium]HLB29769.1 hypothetical protein [Dehalococcoidia bacterium]